jgi:KAP-like P-loop domain-containing protein
MRGRKDLTWLFDLSRRADKSAGCTDSRGALSIMTVSEGSSVDPRAKSVFRADVPPETLSAETDAFGHRDYAATIASAVAEAEPPFTLGLFGPWGVGKTTILEEVGRSCRPGCAFAIFDRLALSR